MNLLSTQNIALDMAINTATKLRASQNGLLSQKLR